MNFGKRKKNILYWIKIGCSLALKKDRRKAWKWVKKNALYSIKGFLKNPHIPILYKRMLFSAIVIGQVSYYAPPTYLDLTKIEREVYTGH